jgi:hypothetical protein
MEQALRHGQAASAEEATPDELGRERANDLGFFVGLGLLLPAGLALWATAIWGVWRLLG